MVLKLKTLANYSMRNSDPAIRNVGDVLGNDGLDDSPMVTDDDLTRRGRVSLVSGAVSATGTATLALRRRRR